MKLLSEELLDGLAAQATASPRRRAHHILHAGPADLVQRFIVLALPDSYFRPHRHNARSELALMVRGHVDVLTFDEDGRVTARHAIGAGTGNFAYETPMRTWHTVVPGADGGAFFEVKEGPYDPATAAEFAPWSPAEGATATDAYRAWLLRAQPGELSPR